MNRRWILGIAGTALIVGCRGIAGYSDADYFSSGGGGSAGSDQDSSAGHSGPVDGSFDAPSDVSTLADVALDGADGTARHDALTDAVTEADVLTDARTDPDTLVSDAAGPDATADVQDASSPTGTINCSHYGYPQCPSGQYCMASYDPGQGAYTIACVATVPRPGVGQTCGTGSACADGLQCSFSYPRWGYVCLPTCVTNDDCTDSRLKYCNFSMYLKTGTYTANNCSVCDPTGPNSVLMDCPLDTACMVETQLGDPICRAGYRHDAVAGDPCGGPTDCNIRQICVCAWGLGNECATDPSGDGGTDDAGAKLGRCRQACRPYDRTQPIGANDCPTAQVCVGPTWTSLVSYSWCEDQPG